MTEILDSLRKTHFLPFLKMAGTLIPIHPVEVTRLNDIASKLNRYERCGEWDIRGQWLFSTVAGPEEVWAGEFLVWLGFGLEISFGYPEISARVIRDIIFMDDLRRRLPVITK
jgi:hypothetical protein